MPLTDKQHYVIRSIISSILDRMVNTVDTYPTTDDKRIPGACEKTVDIIEDVFSHAVTNPAPVVLPRCMISQLSFLPSQREKGIEAMKNVLRGLFIADMPTLRKMLLRQRWAELPSGTPFDPSTDLMFMGKASRGEVLPGEILDMSSNTAHEIRQEMVTCIARYFNMRNNPEHYPIEHRPTPKCMEKIQLITNLYLDNHEQETTCERSMALVCTTR